MAETQILEPQPAVVEPKTFYSRSKGLALHANKGRRVLVDGQLERVGEIIVEFTECDPQFGSYTTDDPEVIAFLEARRLKHGDVMTVTEYNDAILPDDKKIDGLRNENAHQSRVIEEQNRLIAQLRKGSKVPVPVQTQ